MDRTLWISRHILPQEQALRRYLSRQKLPPFLDADDIVQDVYSRIAEMPSVTAIRDARSFMLGVGRNVVREYLRRARIVSIQSTEDMANFDARSDEPSPEEQVSDREQLHLLALAIGELPEPSRSAFRLRVIEELPHKAIGEQLGITENAVQKCYAKSLLKLLNLLGRGGNTRSHATGKGHDPMKASGDDRARDERGH